jgi:hypothetical protein
MLAHIPALLVYNSYTFYQAADLPSLSLGNMGFSETRCLSKSVSSILGEESEGINLHCNSGMMAELIDFGVATQYED